LDVKAKKRKSKPPHSSLSFPGVYIEEIPTPVRTIIGISTSVMAFIGLAKKGPANRPVKITSLAEYERLFGGLIKESYLSLSYYCGILISNKEMVSCIKPVFVVTTVVVLWFWCGMVLPKNNVYAAVSWKTMTFQNHLSNSTAKFAVQVVQSGNRDINSQFCNAEPNSNCEIPVNPYYQYLVIVGIYLLMLLNINLRNMEFLASAL
jgi:phage tail sheath protein FI